MPILGSTVRLQDGRLATIQDYRPGGIAVVRIEHGRSNTFVSLHSIATR